VSKSEELGWINVFHKKVDFRYSSWIATTDQDAGDAVKAEWWGEKTAVRLLDKDGKVSSYATTYEHLGTSFSGFEPFEGYPRFKRLFWFLTFKTLQE
jgi:hypothetical protein